MELEIPMAEPKGKGMIYIYVEDDWPVRRSYRVEDFLWTGSGDGQDFILGSSDLTTMTVVHTTIFPTPVLTSPHHGTVSPTCCVTGVIRPTSTLGPPLATPRPTLPPVQAPDQRFWLLTVVQMNLTQVTPSQVDLENKLARLYRLAFNRQQEHHLGIGNATAQAILRQRLRRDRDRRVPEPVNVYLHNQSSEGSARLALLYSVHVDGKPVLAYTAAADMKLVSTNEATAELGFPILTKAEPYLKDNHPLDGGWKKARSRDTWLLVGSAVAAVALLLLLAVLLALGLGKRKRNKRRTGSVSGHSSPGMLSVAPPLAVTSIYHGDQEGSAAVGERKGSATSLSSGESSEASLVRRRAAPSSRRKVNHRGMATRLNSCNSYTRDSNSDMVVISDIFDSCVVLQLGEINVFLRKSRVVPNLSRGEDTTHLIKDNTRIRNEVIRERVVVEEVREVSRRSRIRNEVIRERVVVEEVREVSRRNRIRNEVIRERVVVEEVCEVSRRNRIRNEVIRERVVVEEVREVSRRSRIRNEVIRERVVVEEVREVSRRNRIRNEVIRERVVVEEVCEVSRRNRIRNEVIRERVVVEEVREVSRRSRIRNEVIRERVVVEEVREVQTIRKKTRSPLPSLEHTRNAQRQYVDGSMEEPVVPTINAAISPNSFLSMPSIKAFPRGASIPEPLARVLEPVSVKYLDSEAGLVLEPARKMARHGSLEGEDPGVVGPLVWDMHCHRMHCQPLPQAGCLEGNLIEDLVLEAAADDLSRPDAAAPNMGRMRQRFQELLDDAFSLFGSRSVSPAGGVEEDSSTPPTLHRVRSAIVRSIPFVSELRPPMCMISAFVQLSSYYWQHKALPNEFAPRPRTSDYRRPATAAAGTSRPRGAWGTAHSSPPTGRSGTLPRPLSAGPFHRPQLPVPAVDRVLVLSEEQLPLADPAIPLIAAIKEELCKFQQPPAVSLPGST
ncbi:unnamed protein product [Timema podura]|uniref:Uncharacterized protein n=1 Tax=Timema podura TaxID=61482 RepID=A0ABN7NH82_TIMPD|nr:unnamed protein product [Timema podura]